MEPSDWIALAALAASVIISIAGFWFNYKTNKENIRARRTEIVTEKSIEAYREVVEKITALVLEVGNGVNGSESARQFRKTLELFEKDAKKTVAKYILYLPGSVGSDFTAVLNSLHELVENKSSFSVEDQKKFEMIINEYGNLLERVQKFIGLEGEIAPGRVKLPTKP